MHEDRLARERINEAEDRVQMLKTRGNTRQIRVNRFQVFKKQLMNAFGVSKSRWATKRRLAPKSHARSRNPFSRTVPIRASSRRPDDGQFFDEHRKLLGRCSKTMATHKLHFGGVCLVGACFCGMHICFTPTPHQDETRERKPYG